jgi:hypothetical protein
MRTVKWSAVLSGLCAILGGAVLWIGTAKADVTADNAAGLIVWPKLVYDSDAGVDTVIQLSNTSGDQINVRCFYVNANSHCSNAPDEVCNVTADCQQYGAGGLCIPGWVETDFSFRLTAHQPIIWRVSDGLPFFPLDGLNRVGPGGQSNGPESSIPPVAEDPFVGELKCVEVGDTEEPVGRNDLKGEATIVTATEALLDARDYNALGVHASEEADVNNGDNTLVLGDLSNAALGAEYNGCPNILILDHFFDDALVFSEPNGVPPGYVRTHLTVVPCSENFVLQDVALFNTTIQFLVYNEFEQRYSTSRPVRCFKEFELSAIALGAAGDRAIGDTDPASNNQQRSIFNVNVQGTLTGHTRMRPVDDGEVSHGNGLIGIAEEFHRTASDDLSTVRASAAFQLDQDGVRPDVDIIQMP